jgi:hypothetical protein
MLPGMSVTFTVSQAATQCGVSRRTITRKIEQLAELGATKDSTGQWRIPVPALLAAGLHPGRPTPPDTDPLSQGGDPAPAQELSRLRAELAAERAARTAAEALAAERAERIADLKHTLLMIEAHPRPVPTPAPVPAGGAEPGALGRARRWLLG